MDMSEAIASYLHLAFTFNLKYSKEVFLIFARDHMWSYFLQGAQTIADIMQRRVAKYGDDSGKLMEY